MRALGAVITAALVAATLPMTPAAASTPDELVSQVRSVAGTPQGLTRGRFGSASLTSRDWRGCDALQRALISASITRPRVGAHCQMTGGSWYLTSEQELVQGAENVRVVPVLTKAEAWAQGAFGWSPAQRQAYANSFPARRSYRASSSAARACTFNSRGTATGVGCGYAVVSSDLQGTSLLSALESSPDTLDCPSTTALLGTLVAWDLSLGAPQLDRLRTLATSCSDDVEVPRVRTPMDMQAIYSRNAYVSGSMMLSSTDALLNAPAGTPVQADFFGLHVLPGSGRPTVPFGLVRLWDAGVGWDTIQPRRGEFDWTGMDRIVNEAVANGQHVLYTIGRTPWWAADRKTSPPKRMSDLANFIKAMARRYGNRIYAYEMWNEANLTSYFTGTPGQMAQMTKTVHDAVAKSDVNSLVVAASTTVRIMATTYRFYPPYLAALRSLDWPIDAFAVHTYPRPGGGPDEHTAGIVMVKAMLDDADAPALPLLDTEVNFGLGGLGLPKRDINAPLAGAYVAQTFLEALRMGLSSVEWYGWTPRTYPLLGLQLDPFTTGTNIMWTSLHERLVGSQVVGCTEQGAVEICGFERAGERFAIAYAPSGRDSLIDVPAQWDRACTLLDECSSIDGNRVVVGISPVVLDRAAAQ